MPEHDVVAVVNKLAELGTRWISFTGGEPTLAREALLAGIWQSSRQKGMFTQLPTNGTLLDPEYLDELGRAGVDIIDLSVDSVQASSSRKGFADHPAEFLSMILNAQRKYGFLLKANVVVTKENVRQIGDIIDFCHCHGFMLSVFLGYASPGKQQTTDSFKQLLKEDDMDQIKEIVSLLKDRQKQGVVFAEPMAYASAWPTFLENKGNKDALWQCEAGSYSLSIDPDGMVRMCNALPAKEGRLGMHYSELTPDYYKHFQRNVEATKLDCQKKCMAAAYFCSQYYRKHRFQFLSHPFYLR